MQYLLKKILIVILALDSKKDWVKPKSDDEAAKELIDYLNNSIKIENIFDIDSIINEKIITIRELLLKEIEIEKELERFRSKYFLSLIWLTK